MDRKTMLELREQFDNTDQTEAIERATLIDEPPEADPLVTTSLRLPRSLLDWVRTQAEAEHVRPTALIRAWIEERRAGAPTTLTGRLERLEHAVFDVEQRDPNPKLAEAVAAMTALLRTLPLPTTLPADHPEPEHPDLPPMRSAAGSAPQRVPPPSREHD
jgi:hypothetical protein